MEENLVYQYRVETTAGEKLLSHTITTRSPYDVVYGTLIVFEDIDGREHTYSTYTLLHITCITKKQAPNT